MSSFATQHAIYLFEMRNGKKKLAYGESPADALAILAMRLSPAEMAEIVPDRFEKISQRKLQAHLHELG